MGTFISFHSQIQLNLSLDKRSDLSGATGRFEKQEGAEKWLMESGRKSCPSSIFDITIFVSLSYDYFLSFRANTAFLLLVPPKCSWPFCALF